jgi:type IV pilus assembly protein PilW
MNTFYGNMTSPLRSAGLTLIEVMVAIVIALILLAVTISVFVGNKRAYSEQEELGRLQENARYALESLTRDIRMAGYNGCGATKNPLTVHNHVNSNNNYQNIIEGYSGATRTWYPACTAGCNPSNTAPTLGIILGPDAYSDGITVRYVDTSSLIPVSVAMANTSSTLTISPVQTAAQLRVVGQQISVFNCASTDIFNVTAIAPPGTYPGAATINFGAPLNLAINNDPGGCTATPAQLCNIYGPPSGWVSLGNLGFNENSYYIGDADCNNATPDPTNAVNLCRGSVGGIGQPVAEGIERMQILFGEDTTPDGNVAPDVYRTADLVANWANVVSVQIALLARTPDQYGVNIDTHTYNLLNKNYGNFNDRYRRRVYTNTVQLRNRNTSNLCTGC